MRIRTALCLGVMLAAIAAPVAAAVPANDLPGGAIAIPEPLPQTIAQDTTEATVGADDIGCGTGGIDQATVWYTFTPTSDTFVRVDATASDYGVGVNVFEGAADSANLVNCFEGPGTFMATAGTTYYIMFADVDGDGINGGNLNATLSVAPPPIEVDLAVASVAFDQAGQATVTGTVTCSEEATVTLFASLHQAVGRFAIDGFGEAFDVTCGPTPTEFSITLFGNGAFRGGWADLFLEAFAQSEDNDGSAVLETRVRLSHR